MSGELFQLGCGQNNVRNYAFPPLLSIRETEEGKEKLLNAGLPFGSRPGD